MSLTTKTQANPGAGAEAVVTVPAGKWWVVRSVHLKLVTAVAVANRLARLTVDDGTNIIFTVPNDVSHAASQTTEYSFGQAATSEAAPGATVGARIYAIPPLVLGPGYRIRTITAAIQAADQFSEITALVEETGSDPTLIFRANASSSVG